MLVPVCAELETDICRVAVDDLVCPSVKGNSLSQKVTTNLKLRRGWRKQENQQYKARQDRLNCSRKHRNDELCVSSEETSVRNVEVNHFVFVS